jgi:hypothetical protein
MKRLCLLGAGLALLVASALPTAAADVEIDVSKIMTNLNGDALKDCVKAADETDPRSKCVSSVDMTIARFCAIALNLTDFDSQGRPVPLKPVDINVRGHLSKMLMDASVPTTPGHGKIKLDTRDIDLLDQQLPKMSGFPPSVISQAMDAIHPPTAPANN